MQRHDLAIYPNILDQNFKTERRNQVWLADITYIHTDEGFITLAAVMDLHSRKTCPREGGDCRSRG